MKVLAALALTVFSSLAIAEDETPFDITEMEHGESVTLPSPATTLVPVALHYRVAPTDKNQVFKISSPSSACTVQLKVFDKTSEAVKLVTLRAGESLVYRFERFNGVRVASEPLHPCQKMAKLVLESNRPLEIGM